MSSLHYDVVYDVVDDVDIKIILLGHHGLALYGLLVQVSRIMVFTVHGIVHAALARYKSHTL